MWTPSWERGGSFHVLVNSQIAFLSHLVHGRAAVKQPLSLGFCHPGLTLCRKKILFSAFSVNNSNITYFVMEQQTYFAGRSLKKNEDKPFYAAYLNTAKQNVFLIIRDISARLGLKFDVKDDHGILKAELWGHLKNGTDPVLTLQITEMLKKKFPFAQLLAEDRANRRNKGEKPTPGDYFEELNDFIQHLYDYRNFYTHAKHEWVNIPNKTVKRLELLFDSARPAVQEKYLLHPDEVKHLVRLEAGRKEATGFHYSFKKGREMSQNGFLFFTCLWLQRKEAQKFLTQHSGFKRSMEAREKATLEVFTFNSLRLPKHRLSSDNTRQGLLLDMVNELKRCPKQLYNLLSPEDRDKFREINEENEEVESVRHNNRFFYLALRYLDSAFEGVKFQVDLGNYCFHAYEKTIEGSPHTRRWIRRMTSFGSPGDFEEDNCPEYWKGKVQKLEDKERESKEAYVTDTTPHYHINGMNIGVKFFDNYDRLRKSKKNWPALAEFDKEQPKETKPRNTQPDCWLSLYEMPGMAFYQMLYESGHTSISTEKIIEIHYNKMNSFFASLKDGNIAPGPLDKELERRGLQKKQIPKQIVRFLEGKAAKTYNEKAEARLGELIIETERRLNKATKQETGHNSKPGSKDYIEIKCGNMGDFLARDMLMLQKPLNGQGGKANSTEFGILQAKLAFFGKYKKELGQTFETCNLTGSENPHPFLSKITIDKCTGILDFYKVYLEQKLKFLEGCQQEKEYNDYHFLKLNSAKIERSQEYITELASALNNKNRNGGHGEKPAISNLPRGLFTQAILDALLKNEKTRALANEIKQGRYNTAYIIEQYFSKTLQDAPQDFYSYRRSYEVLNKVYDDRSDMRETLKKKFFTNEELEQLTRPIIKNKETTDNQITREIDNKIKAGLKKEKDNVEDKGDGAKQKLLHLYKQFQNNEKQIRLIKNCDMVLFMLAENLLKKEFVTDKEVVSRGNKHKTETPGINLGEKFKLSDIRPGDKNSLLSRQTRVELKLGKKSVAGIMKIKDHGNFRGFLKDRRLTGLMPYIKEDTIDLEALKKELDWYEEARQEAFDTILKFEQQAIKKNNLSPEKEEGYIKHKSILSSVLDKKDEKYTLMLKLRNAFCHSEYPEHEYFGELVPNDGFNILKGYSFGNQEIKDKSIAVRFASLTKRYYNEIIDAISDKN